MSILSGPEILKQIELGNISVEPFDISRIGPNSIDVKLGHQLILMTENEFDLTKQVIAYNTIYIHDEGFLLRPGFGYLGHTMEVISSKGFVPWIDGRSTTGRYFLSIHQTAGRADDGWVGSLTLELVPLYRPVRIYAGLPIAQVSFFKLEGESKPYTGRYQNSVGPKLPKPLTF